jgi:DNA replication protein DnaC
MVSNRNPRWLTLAGPSQRGKTHCAKALWREVKARCEWNPHWVNYTPRLIYWPKFVDDMRSGDRFEEFRDMQRWPFLVLDDCGAERDPNGFATEKLNTLLGCRTGRWTIITTNLLPEDWSKIEPRILSRMARDGSQLVSLTFPAYVQH